MKLSIKQEAKLRAELGYKIAIALGTRQSWKRIAKAVLQFDTRTLRGMVKRLP
jgi:hypothetical protein